MFCVSYFYDRRPNPNSARRDVLELVDARINQELASREYMRAALMPLDDLDQWGVRSCSAIPRSAVVDTESPDY